MKTIPSVKKQTAIKAAKSDKLAIYHAGANPFAIVDQIDIRYVAYSLESILQHIGFLSVGKMDYKIFDKYPIGSLNWNPFLFDKKNKKQYYQRPFVWSVEDKQLLIESIYQGIDCGKILIKSNSWEKLQELATLGWYDELFFNDVVDGKQRLNAVIDFIEGKFADLHGNYYNDLSAATHHHFLRNQLFSFALLGEDVSDADVIKQFLKVNFSGKAMSKEHIEFVKSLHV